MMTPWVLHLIVIFVVAIILLVHHSSPRFWKTCDRGEPCKRKRLGVRHKRRKKGKRALGAAKTIIICFHNRRKTFGYRSDRFMSRFGPKAIFTAEIEWSARAHVVPFFSNVFCMDTP